ncbi:DUF748 domain-containing protein [Solimonas variicoloris]|uniref:DUF748 domain-containing protein n=1 Tax=Solimonas variicoloris TaxID=254408 RepID=UPI00035CB17A|nr:DUF748 domain-containing protein [Solimonas variicoloris]
MHAFLTLLRRRWVALSVTAGMLLLYTLLGFLLVPHVARSALGDYVEQQLGRHLAIGALRFNPYTFVVRVDDLKLTEAAGAPLLGFSSLVVNFEPWTSLFTRSIAFKELTLAGPDVNVVIAADGTLNLARLAPPAEEPKPAASEAATIPRIRVGALTVSDGRVAFEDRSRPQPFRTELKPIRFALTDFRTTADYQNVYRFDAASAAGERFDWSGKFTVQPLGSQGDFGVHGLLATTIADYLQDQLPVQLRSGSIDLNGHYTFALQPALDVGVTLPAITLRDVAVAARDGGDGAPPVAVRQLGVDTLAFSLARRELTIKAVTIDGAKLDVRRERDGSLNLMKLAGGEPAKAAAAPAKEAPAAPADATAPPMRIAVARVQLSDAAVAFEDRTTQPAARFMLAPIAASVGGYRNDADATLDIDAQLGIDGRAQLSARGTTRLQPLSAQLALQLDGFPLASVQPYVAQAAEATVHSGTLAVKGDLDLAQAADGTMPLRFRGGVKVDGFRASGSGEGQGPHDDFARWKQLAIAGIDFSLAPDRLGIERITLTQPYGRVVINPDQTLNVAQILKPAAPAAASAAPPPKTAKSGAAGAAMPIRVKEIRINDGSAFFADRSIEPSFAAGIVKLRGGVSNLSSDPKSRATIRLDGQVDRYSPVEIRGTSSLLAATEYTDVTLAFRNMELTTFNPYSGKFAGYNIAKGKLTTELSYKISARELEAEHHVIVDQLEFGEATNSKDAAPLPIKLAVALLKDRRGVIDLELPVRGSLDDPDFKYGKIVWKVLGNIVTKIVTAPFAALGSLFGGGDELSYVDFPAGAATLTARAAGKLDTLGKALVERPQLKLEVPVIVADADRDALARSALAARLPADLADDKARLRAFEKLHRELLKQPVKYPDGSDETAARIAYVEPLLLARLAPSDEALQQLGHARAQAVQGALLAKPDLSAERIFITNGAAAKPGDEGMVRMELKLQ